MGAPASNFDTRCQSQGIFDVNAKISDVVMSVQQAPDARAEIGEAGDRGDSNNDAN
jgi:hypothetical protein